MPISVQAFKIGPDLGSSLIAKIAIFLQSLIDDSFQLGRQIGIEANWSGWSLVKDGIEDCCRGGSLERQASGSHFVEHNAERKQIRARVKVFAQRLFRAHIGDRSEG